MIALDRELVQRFAPLSNRPALAALFSIEKEVLDTLRPTLEHTVSHAKLGWWSDELERLALGRPAHPAAVALARVAEARGRSAPDLRALAEHASVALACIAFVERDELDAHLRHWASARAGRDLDHASLGGAAATPLEQPAGAARSGA
ncbi:MAG: hypothetical protein EBZ91_05385 [Gammaproteobacteria bacterium]|nr:hypothetical protein [Gammaproteobacteria bacterium]